MELWLILLLGCLFSPAILLSIVAFLLNALGILVAVSAVVWGSIDWVVSKVTRK